MDNRYTEYDLKDFEYCFPISFDYMRQKNKPTIKWVYGDTIKLTFDLSNYEVGNWDFTKPSFINIVFKNFRQESIKVVEQQVYQPEVVTVNIGKEESRDLFKNGLYYIDVELVSDTEFSVLQKNIEVAVG